MNKKYGTYIQTDTSSRKNGSTSPLIFVEIIGAQVGCRIELKMLPNWSLFLATLVSGYFLNEVHDVTIMSALLEMRNFVHR